MEKRSSLLLALLLVSMVIANERNRFLPQASRAPPPPAKKGASLFDDDVGSSDSSTLSFDWKLPIRSILSSSTSHPPTMTKRPTLMDAPTVRQVWSSWSIIFVRTIIASGRCASQGFDFASTPISGLVSPIGSPVELLLFGVWGGPFLVL